MTNPSYTSRWTRAFTNIALIKYWGKADEALIIPKNNSLSLTLDAFYTDTRVSFIKELDQDELWIDGQKQTGSALKKILTLLDLVRDQAKVTWPAKVESINHVPTAAGLASSASGLAALAGAATDALNLNPSITELSRLARRGSGSASRSVLGGFVEWEKGTNHQSSFAKQIDAANWDVAMLFVIVDGSQKAVSSSQGMKLTVETSQFYQAWLDTVDQDLTDIKAAIHNQDVNLVGKIAERNAMKMHATNLAADPPFTYWNEDSLTVMSAVRAFRQAGLHVHFTMDAGPNVKIIGNNADLQQVKAQFAEKFDESQLIIAKPGPGIQYLSD